MNVGHDLYYNRDDIASRLHLLGIKQKKEIISSSSADYSECLHMLIMD
jgi:hypothetical protein